MRDLTDIINEDDMPNCPLCDSPIRPYEPATSVSCGDRKALVHLDCVDQNEEYDDVLG